VRTRTVISQAHSFQWLGSFGNRGNGRSREELRKGIAAIGRYLTGHQLPRAHTLLRLDGQYGTGAVLTDLAGFAFVTRGKEYTALDHPLVQSRLHLPPDQFQQRPESLMVRSLYDCPEIPMEPEGVLCRVIVATHQASNKKSPVGVTRAGIVYELFFTNLPQRAFTAVDVVELYLHRGAFEPTLSDEDQEIDPDRWCSHSAWGQECWQVVAQWVWNIRLELGHQLHPDPVRTVSRLLLPSRRRMSTPPRVHPPQRPHRGMLHPPRLPPGKLAVSPAPTFLSSPMERSGVRQGSRFESRSGVGKLTEVCAWCMRPVLAVAARVRSASSVNGKATPRQSRARSACSCIRSRLVLPRSSGATPAAEHIGVPACSSCATSALR
jgi:hypothetical protein